MAKWNKELTFEAIIDARGNHNRWDTDFDTLERSVCMQGVRFHEGGRISFECGFDNNPDGRMIVGNMAKEFNVSTIKELGELYLPDGTKIPKAWVDQNYCVVIDYEHNRIVNATRSWTNGYILSHVEYTHRDAMPRTSSVFLVNIPDRKATARALMELEPQRLAAVAAWRMSENAKRYASDGELTNAVKAGDVTSNESAQILAGSYSDEKWKEVVKQAFTTAIQVPYLLPKPFGKK